MVVSLSVDTGEHGGQLLCLSSDRLDTKSNSKMIEDCAHEIDNLSYRKVAKGRVKSALTLSERGAAFQKPEAQRLTD